MLSNICKKKQSFTKEKLNYATAFKKKLYIFEENELIDILNKLNNFYKVQNNS